jgi:prepilin-type N-terminal cleavage/methylation domain-containing protein
MSRRARAFTLLEVLAVVLILGLVFLVIGNTWAGIAKTTTGASPTETTRRGLLLVDRIARDLAGATLVEKPEELDPLQHPWLFYAESRLAQNGADRLKFDSRTARSSAEHAGDLAVVAYWTEPGDADDLRLLRWTSPALPEGLDRELPRSGDDGAQVVASGLTRFGVQLVDEDGALVSSWDSSTVERSSQLPLAAEITLSLRDETAPEGERTFAKRVVLPMRPFDLEKALAGEEDGEDDEDDEDEDEGCVTVGECQAANAAAFAAAIAQAADPASIQAALDASRDQCWADFAGGLGLDLPVSCE